MKQGVFVLVWKKMALWTSNQCQFKICFPDYSPRVRLMGVSLCKSSTPRRKLQRTIWHRVQNSGSWYQFLASARLVRGYSVLKTKVHLLLVHILQQKQQIFWSRICAREFRTEPECLFFFSQNCSHKRKEKNILHPNVTHVTLLTCKFIAVNSESHLPELPNLKTLLGF